MLKLKIKIRPYRHKTTTGEADRKLGKQRDIGGPLKEQYHHNVFHLGPKTYRLGQK
jgi:hypothetical protein